VRRLSDPGKETSYRQLLTKRLWVDGKVCRTDVSLFTHDRLVGVGQEGNTDRV
jgi:hypothetical protein